MALDACAYTVGLPERACANVEKLLAWLRREFRDRPRPRACSQMRGVARQ